MDSHFQNTTTCYTWVVRKCLSKLSNILNFLILLFLSSEPKHTNFEDIFGRPHTLVWAVPVVRKVCPDVRPSGVTTLNCLYLTQFLTDFGKILDSKPYDQALQTL